MGLQSGGAIIRGFFCVCTLLRICLIQANAFECDWVGSGLNQKESRGVQTVYLQCAQGQVEWMYPRGALRLVLRYGPSGRDFRGCIRGSHNFSGARIYLEGHQKLHLLFSKNDGRHKDLLRCFVSNSGQLALYIEAEPVKNDLQREAASFAYHLQPYSKVALLDDLSECRPCTEEELLHYYCVSDFVIRGTVSSMTHNPELERTEITVRAVKVHRDSNPPVISVSAHDSDDTYGKYGTLHRPLKCGTKFGSGEFLFLGSRILDNPVIRCAPRLTEWKKIRRKAILAGTQQCNLEL